MWRPATVGLCTYCPLLGRAFLKQSAHWGTLEQARNTHISFQYKAQWGMVRHTTADYFKQQFQVTGDHHRFPPNALQFIDHVPIHTTWPTCESEHVVKEVQGNTRDLTGGASLALARRVGGGAKLQAEMWILELPTRRLGYTHTTALFNRFRKRINLNHILNTQSVPRSKHTPSRL